MNKFVLLIAFVMSLALFANGAVTVVEDGSEWLKASYPQPAAGEDVRIRLQMRLASRLGLLETATTVCFRTDETYALAQGAKGFGMQFLCAINDCTSNTHLHSVLFASEIKSTEPAVWAGAGIDLSHTNRGVHTLNGGRRPDTIYGMSATDFASSNLPAKNEEVHFRCFLNYDGSYNASNLLTDIQLEAGVAGEESEWTAVNVHLNAPEPTVDTEAPATDESSTPIIDVTISP